jgi:hypothetical protein
MRPDDVRDWLQKRPFQRFRIHLTDSTVFEIRHPEQAIVMRATVIVGVQAASQEDAGLTSRDWELALLQITSLEPILPGPS